VLGAGVTGASVAYALSRRGHSVTVIDAAPEVAGAGCSYANAALIAPSHVGPLATRAALVEMATSVWQRPAPVRVHADASVLGWLVRLARSAFSPHINEAMGYLRDFAHRSADLHAQWHAAGANPTYRPVRSLDIYRRRRVLRGGRGPHFLTAEQLQGMEPQLASGAGQGLAHEDEAITESRGFVQGLLSEVASAGGRLRLGVEVKELLIRDGQVRGARTSDGVIEGDAVVVCAGVDSAPMLRTAGLDLPLRGGRGYVVDVAKTSDDLSHVVRLKGQRVVITPLDDRIRVAGYMEFGAEGKSVDATRARRLFEAAAQHVPSLRGRTVLQHWAGERPLLPDGLPAIGAVSSMPGLHLAVGAGMWGMVLGPATGEIIADGIARPREVHVPAWLGADRFEAPGGRVEVSRAGLAN